MATPVPSFAMNPQNPQNPAYVPMYVVSPPNETNEMKASLAAVQREAEEVKKQLEIVKEEASNMKTELAALKATNEEQLKSFALLSKQVAESNMMPDPPVFSDVNYNNQAEYREWYLKMLVKLKTLEHLDNNSQIDYVISRLSGVAFRHVADGLSVMASERSYTTPHEVLKALTKAYLGTIDNDGTVGAS